MSHQSPPTIWPGAGRERQATSTPAGRAGAAGTSPRCSASLSSRRRVNSLASARLAPARAARSVTAAMSPG